MTLPELLIAITVIGMIIAVLSSAVVVTMRQESGIKGRLNVAQAEQSIGMWLPSDLSSAAAVTVDPAATPCDRVEIESQFVVTGDACPNLGLPAGSNALLIGWSVTDASGNVTYTNVSYYFAPAPDGSTYELHRIECTSTGGAWTCDSRILLRDLPGPPVGTEFIPGFTKPDWVIQVSEPLAADGVTEEDVIIGGENAKNAKRVVVTVNGGGWSDGRGGGTNQISITAGGTNRNVIDGTSLQGAPSFAEALSLCGGPMVLLVDESNSIGADINQVRDGVREFVKALIGTPVKLQVIGFHTYSHVLGTSDWHKYYEMTNEADVAALLSSIDSLKGSWPSNDGTQSGGTNWEEAFFRAFYTPTGTTAEPVPETLVFFTDGVPTFDRLVHKTDPGVLPAEPPDPGPAWPDSTGSSYSQVAFDRANFIAAQVRASVRLIGVGIGGADTGSSVFMNNPPAGYHLEWERGYRQYQQGASAFQSNIDFEKGDKFDSRLDFERAASFKSRQDFEQRVSGNWTDRSPTQYYANNTTPDSTDNWRIRSSDRSWYSVTETEYDNYSSASPSDWKVGTWANTTPTLYYTNQPGAPTKYRIGGSGSWRLVTEAEYDAYRALSSSDWRVDGWTDTTANDYLANQPGHPTRYRIAGTRSSWTDVTQAQYDANNVNSGESDGWRIGLGSLAWVSKASYDANNTTPDSFDGWNDTGSKEYVSASLAMDWVEWTGSRSGIPSDQLRSTEVYEPPYDDYQPAQTETIPNWQVLGQLITGGDEIELAAPTGGPYTNVETADLYKSSNWAQLPVALKAIALGECGGTLTIQTKLNGSAAPDPFTYLNSAQYAPDGSELGIEPKTVLTNLQFTTGNFDFKIDSGLYRDVVIVPEELADLAAYDPAGWTCRAGTANRSFDLVDIPGAEASPWKGIKVRVAANEAVSCIQTVTR